MLQLGRFVLDYNGPLDVDHIDRNPLNNQKYNLRAVTDVVNLRNSGRALSDVPHIKGIYWDNLKGRYKAYVRRNKKLCYVGSYKEAKDAINALENRPE